MKKKVVIYGTGKYGNRIYAYLIGLGIMVDYFCKTEAIAGDVFNGISVISPQEIETQNTIVIIAIQNNCVIREIAGMLKKLGFPENALINGAALMRWHIPVNTEKTSKNGFTCTICNMQSEEFLPIFVDSDLFNKHHIIGGGTRQHCYCPICGSSDRERWQKIVLEKYTGVFFERCRVLHIAPESSIEPLIRRNPYCDYYTGDLEPGKAGNVVDVNKIQFLDETFDYIIMNHVLEHIPDESRCLKELKRVLKAGGVLILSFPICTDMKTDDDSSVIGEVERLERFGQKDHVRLYGFDYKERLEQYGFRIEIANTKDYKHLVSSHGLIEDDIVVLARKS